MMFTSHLNALLSTHDLTVKDVVIVSDNMQLQPEEYLNAKRRSSGNGDNGGCTPHGDHNDVTASTSSTTVYSLQTPTAVGSPSSSLSSSNHNKPCRWSNTITNMGTSPQKHQTHRQDRFSNSGNNANANKSTRGRLPMQSYHSDSALNKPVRVRSPGPILRNARWNVENTDRKDASLAMFAPLSLNDKHSSNNNNRDRDTPVLSHPLFENPRDTHSAGGKTNKTMKNSSFAMSSRSASSATAALFTLPELPEHSTKSPMALPEALSAFKHTQSDMNLQSRRSSASSRWSSSSNSNSTSAQKKNKNRLSREFLLGKPNKKPSGRSSAASTSSLASSSPSASMIRHSTSRATLR